MFMRRPRPLFASALVLLWVSVAMADPVAPAPGAVGSPGVVAISWDDIRRAAENSPQFAAGAANLSAARAGARAAAVPPNPSLTAGAAYARPENGDSGTEWILELSVPLGWLAARGPAVKAARAEVASAEAGAETLRREALSTLRGLFWRVVIDQRRVANWEEMDAEVQRLSRAVKLRVDRGDARPVEQVRVEVETEKAATELAAARVSLAGSREQLRGWLNLPPGVEIVAVADPDALPASMDLDAARARVGADPRVAAARARVRQMEAERETARLGQLPEISVAPFVEEELDVRRSGVGLTTPLPLWDWNTARVAQADARLDAARAELRAAEAAADSDVVAAQAGCEAATSAAVSWRDRVIPRAQSAAATVERAWQLGEARLSEVIEARRILLDTRSEYLDALDRSRTECGRLYTLAGEDQP